MTSVCTGLLAYAAATTTHWRSLDLLGKLDPTIDVRPHERVVDAGGVLTSASISAMIDTVFHSVKRLTGIDRAQEVRRGIAYNPASPV